MANTFARSEFRATVGVSSTGSTGASHSSGGTFTKDYRSSGVYVITNVLELSDYSLTVAAGNLDIDLYDLGTLDIGAGAGRDNLGNTWAQSKVHSVFIENEATSVGTLRIDQAGLTTTAWTGLFGGNTVLDLPAGSCVSAYLGDTGATVTDVTNHLLRLSAQTDTCTISVHITTS